MPTPRCAACGKSAYPLESVNAIDKVYHKTCFKCETCHLQLTLSNFKGLDGKVYCSKHVPQVKATAVVDTIAMKQATSVPKKVAEGLGNVQKGSGGKPNVTVFGAGSGSAAPSEVPQEQEQAPVQEQAQEQAPQEEQAAPAQEEVAPQEGEQQEQQ